MDGKKKVSLWAAAAGPNLLVQYKFLLQKLYCFQVDIFELSKVVSNVLFEWYGN